MDENPYKAKPPGAKCPKCQSDNVAVSNSHPYYIPGTTAGIGKPYSTIHACKCADSGMGFTFEVQKPGNA